MKTFTLKTLHLATPQQVFDQVAKHLLTQNEQSSDDSGDKCCYLSPLGLKCAAGCLIADDEYDPSWEGTSWGSVGPIYHRLLIECLQEIHDEYYPNEWSKELSDYAARNNLSYNEELYT